MPVVRLGTLEVARLLLGSNAFGGHAHRPGTDLRQQMKAYYTDERIVATLEQAAACGLTAVVAPPTPSWLALYARYLAEGGKLRIWIAQPDGPPEQIPGQIAAAVAAGARAVFIQGHRVEEQVAHGAFEVLEGWLGQIRRLGVPAGLAAHRPEVHLEAQRRGLPVEFYCQSFYNIADGDRFDPGDPARALATIRQLHKPVIAYKILGAGRIDAPQGLAFALRHLRTTDALCVGVFTRDDPHQVQQNAALVRRLSAHAP